MPTLSRFRQFTKHEYYSPAVMLMIMVAVMQISFASWRALINNYAIGEIGFNGADIGLMQSLREVPGLLSFTVLAFLPFIREQRMILISLVVLGIGTAMTGYLGSAFGLYLSVVIMSVGFHYYEALNQSLALQWFDKKDAPKILGQIIGVASFASILAYGLIYVIWSLAGLSYDSTYYAAGAVTILGAIYLWFGFPKFEQKVTQHKKMIVRKRYGLFYALTFFAGARRQIFTVFASLMMVEKFGYSVAAVSALFLINCVINMWLAPKIGGLIGKWGERRALIVEYAGLVIIFVSYAFVSNAWIAVGLYIVDHVFFAMAIAMKTYFQKIANPADIAPSISVAFSINHITAIFLPAVFGLLWLYDPSLVFLIGAGIATISLALSLLVPYSPEPGREFIWIKHKSTAPAE